MYRKLHCPALILAVLTVTASTTVEAQIPCNTGMACSRSFEPPRDDPESDENDNPPTGDGVVDPGEEGPESPT
jgi:hypothetical protein